LDGKLIYFLYRALQLIGLPFIVLYFLSRGLKDRRYFRHFGQRLGFLHHHYKQTVSGAVWLHAVSVGEVLSSVALLRGLRAAFPSAPLYVSSTTVAGRAIAEQKLKGLVDGVFYAPVDFCFAVKRVLRTLRPAVVVVAETEIWPNLYREAKRIGCGLLIVNGRISDRAVPRYSRLRWFFRHVLALPDKILAQSDASRQRYLALGASPDQVILAGNLKYDFEPREASVARSIRQLLERLQPKEVWIAASTMPPADAADVDEDDVVIETFRELAPRHSGLLLMLVPRRPERFEVVAQKLVESGTPFFRRSGLEQQECLLKLPGVLLVDSMGELSGLFQLADVVFMGGTLATRGGHNILEPAFFGTPVVVGPHMENFPEIAEEFSAANACVEIQNAAALGAAIDTLLNDAELRTTLGGRACRLAEAKRGATERAIREIATLCSKALPCFRPVIPIYHLCWLVSRLWLVGSRGKQKIHSARSESLNTPVVSVGSLNMGGSGKTPFVSWLAERLKSRGHEPAILTRGYRRRAPEKETVLGAGASVPVARTGDEAQIFLRSGVAPVGIGAKRAATGRLLEEQFHPDLFLLDDGFQHWRLERGLDIVLLDALDPFGNCELFPLGRLREPLDALGRADLFVITRAECGRGYEGIKAQLRSHNPQGPIFLSRVIPKVWVEPATGQQWDPGALPFSRVAAFCGLANPASFWRTLASLGVRPITRWTFGDHHHYRPVALQRMARQARAAGAEALLTTEKDLMNLSDHAAECVAPLRLCWLQIGIEVDREEELLQFIGDKVL
jgi:tetraacyldisaccharide 4'-kinase